MERKRELKQQYKEMKPKMGVFAIRSKADGKVFLEAAADLKSAMNSNRFKLRANMHGSKELQEWWNRYGADNFVFEIVEELDYCNEGDSKDYSDELETLKELCGERFSKKDLYDGS